MGSYGAAKTAVKSRLATNWTTTRIAYQNETPADPWPPQTADPGAPDIPSLAPFVYFEMVTLPGQSLRGVGVPGSQVSITDGFIYVHVFVPNGTGETTATQYAEQIGELFRNEVVYNANDGCYLRTWVPRVDEGGKGSFDSDEIANVSAGAWFRVTMSVPFQYWHRG